MKIKNIGKCIVNKAKVITCYGNAGLIRRANGRHELIGGTESDFTAARDDVTNISAYTVSATKVAKFYRAVE